MCYCCSSWWLPWFCLRLQVCCDFPFFLLYWIARTSKQQHWQPMSWNMAFCSLLWFLLFVPEHPGSSPPIVAVGGSHCWLLWAWLLSGVIQECRRKRQKEAACARRVTMSLSTWKSLLLLFHGSSLNEWVPGRSLKIYITGTKCCIEQAVKCSNFNEEIGKRSDLRPGRPTPVKKIYQRVEFILPWQN